MICFNDEDVILFAAIVGSIFVLSIVCLCAAKCRQTNAERPRLQTERSYLRSPPYSPPLGGRPTQPPPLPPITNQSGTRQSFNYILPVFKEADNS